MKNDIKAIDIRIGVVTNTLLQLKLRERAKQSEDNKQLDILENEYEVEMWEPNFENRRYFKSCRAKQGKEL